MTSIKGQLISGNKGFKSNNVGLYKITSIKSKKPKLIALTSSDRDGFFEFTDTSISPKNIYYISAKNRSSILSGLLKSHTHQDLTINDRSTVASGIVFNHFIEGDHIRGSKSSRRSGWMTYKISSFQTEISRISAQEQSHCRTLESAVQSERCRHRNPSIQRKPLRSR